MEPPSPVSESGSHHDISEDLQPSQTNSIPNPHIIINTPFQINNPVNKKMPFATTDPNFIWKWTKEQRQLTKNAETAKDTEDLEKKVCPICVIYLLR